MKNLDDRIVFTLTDNVTGHSSGMYQYQLRRLPFYGGTNELIFTGNFYYNGVDSAVTLDVTDIIASDGFVIREDDFNNTQSIASNIVNKYGVVIFWGSSVSLSNYPWIAKVYPYRNKTLSPHDNSIFFQPDSATTSVSVLQQGYNPSGDGDCVLMPHYPLMTNASQCPYGLSMLVGDSIGNISITCKVGNSEYAPDNYTVITPINKVSNSITFTSNLGTIAPYNGTTKNGSLLLSDEVFVTSSGELDTQPSSGWDLYRSYPQGNLGENIEYRYAYVRIRNTHNVPFDDESVDYNDIEIGYIIYCNKPYPEANDDAYNEDDDTFIIFDDGIFRGNVSYKVGILDGCYKRYYLFWQDRYGSFQCQAFNDVANYSESFDRMEIQDYQNRRRNGNIQVQSKWKLNSGWISENLYPYYESIYTSPILFLYDTELDRRFAVMVSGDYEEKTYRNQKKLINMNLELQENKKQNIIW